MVFEIWFKYEFGVLVRISKEFLGLVFEVFEYVVFEFLVENDES